MIPLLYFYLKVQLATCDHRERDEFDLRIKLT